MPVAACSVVVLGAGLGTRMRSRLPKVLHPIAGLPMVHHVLNATRPLSPGKTVVVVGPDMDDLAKSVAPHPVAVQAERLGTADAVKAARSELAEASAGAVLVVFGDTPFLKTETLSRMLDAVADGATVVVLGFEAENPKGYGRLVRDADGTLRAIVEDRDASDEERRITLCNSGVMAIAADRLFDLVDRIGNDNAKGEYYLTDIVGLARADGLRCAAIEAPEAELLGVDSKADLAAAEARFQSTRRAAALAAGVTMTAPETVWFAHDTALGAEVEIGPNVVFGPGVRIADGATIRAFCHIEGARIGPGATVGPFARLRPGTEIGKKARIGNFVEVKNAVFGEGAKANHLSYLGDAAIGANANIGAGTITCNYDGYRKARTEIRDGAFIGSNSALVAPVEIGEGAIVGAGSVITRNVPADAIAIARGEQNERAGAAARFRESRLAAKKSTKE